MQRWQVRTIGAGLSASKRIKLTKLGVIIISFNAAANIEASLASVAFADEIIVLDSGSTDGTVDIARSLGANVHVSSDWPGFGPQKNHAMGLATSPWILTMDADERVTPELTLQIQRVVQYGAGTGFEIPRLTQFCGQWIRYCGWTPGRVLRLFRRDAARFSGDLVHERVLLDQGLVRKLSSILHYSYPTPAHDWRKLENYSQAWEQQRFALGQKTTMWRAGLASVVAFLRSYVFRLGFLGGAKGFAVCTMQAPAVLENFSP